MKPLAIGQAPTPRVRRVRLAVGIAMAFTLGVPPGVACAAFSALAALQRDGARVSAIAVDLGAGTVLQQLNPDTRLAPASLTKLATAAAALDAWPADRSFQTRLLATAAPRNGVLNGDLILRGSGDPSLDDRALGMLALELKAEGIRSVTGRLIVNEYPFAAIPCGTPDRCDALRRSERAYNAPLASIGVDFGSWCVLVRPTAVGEPATVRGCGVAHLPVPVLGKVLTTTGSTPSTLRVERETEAGEDRLRVGGGIPLGSDERIYRAMSDSARGVALLFGEMLQELDISVSGPKIVSAAPLPPETRTLAETEGLTLREQLGRMLRFSNNYVADVLALDLAANGSDSPPPDLAAASATLVNFLNRTRAGSTRPPGDVPLVIASGSGLTPENRLSAADLSALLAYQYRDTRRFPPFYGGLTVPREAAFDFLRHGSDAWLDRVALKTGTMNDPVSVCGLAGYLRKRDGGWIAFAVIVNGSARRSHVPLDTALRAAQSDLEALLARE
jgi:D-alanyl-D-alanine carboxypeptidase/D-alanyl-D-alanine-endopeptidase (penicillin-binding protein 4)